MQRFGQNPHVGFSALLPEFNATFDIDPFQQLFAGLSTGFRSPSASNFTTFTSSGSSATGSNIMKLAAIKSEYDYSYEAGYRFHGDFVTASATAYLQDVRDYQATVQIDPADFITSNIGTVKIYGVDFEAGTKPWHGFTFYGSAELQNSVLSQNVQSDYSGTFPNDSIQYVYSRGKRLVDTPNWIVSASVGYSQDGFFGSLTPQCKGDRPTALNNDEMVPSHCSLDASVGYHFSESWGYLKGAVLQAYIINALDSSYFGEIYTQGQTNAKTAVGYQINQATHAVTQINNISAESYTGEPGSPLFIGVKLSIDVGQ
jgi:iron complex outermembrane receptor protein